MKGFFGEKALKLLLKKDNMIICILTGVLLLVIAWPVKENQEKGEQSVIWDSKDATITYQDTLEEEQEYTEDTTISEPLRSSVTKEEYVAGKLERRLEEVLAAMEGVGQVKVMVTLSNLGEKILEKDIPVKRSVITENDSQGGSRNTNDMNSEEATVYVTDSSGSKIPYVTSETSPVVEGVTVVCQGGDSNVTQKNISEVIQALFGLDAHKIKVVKMKQTK